MVSRRLIQIFELKRAVCAFLAVHRKQSCLCFAQDQGLRPCMVTRRVTIMLVLRTRSRASPLHARALPLIVSRRVTIKRFAVKIEDFKSMRFAHACLCKAKDQGLRPCMQGLRPCMFVRSTRLFPKEGASSMRLFSLLKSCKDFKSIGNHGNPKGYNQGLRP